MNDDSKLGKQYESRSLAQLGWKPFFDSQLDLLESQKLANGQLQAARVAAHFGSQVVLLTTGGDQAIPIQLTSACGDLAVGDWILLEPKSQRATRRLERETTISRRAAGQVATEQLIASNVNTLFIVSSCNQDFNLSRLERYLAVAIESGATPVVILTKADLCDDPALLRQQAEQIHSGLIVETIDARDGQQVELFRDWCRTGQTIALVGSSGVGKSTLANSLGALSIKTNAIREDDAKGRHTTTARSMHPIRFGGWLVDTPGMRELQLANCESAVEDIFEDVIALMNQCQFRNCSHENDQGCAVVAAVESGELDSRRFKNFMKLRAEQERNSESIAERRDKDRKMGKYYKSVIANKQNLKKD